MPGGHKRQLLFVLKSLNLQLVDSSNKTQIAVRGSLKAEGLILLMRRLATKLRSGLRASIITGFKTLPILLSTLTSSVLQQPFDAHLKNEAFISIRLK